VKKSSPPYSPGEIFRMPMWLALLEVFGLTAALIGDGWLDVLSWAALGIPLIAMARALHRSRTALSPDLK